VEELENLWNYPLYKKLHELVTLHADKPKPTNVPKTASNKINVGLDWDEAVLTGQG